MHFNHLSRNVCFASSNPPQHALAVTILPPPLNHMEFQFQVVSFRSSQVLILQFHIPMCVNGGCKVGINARNEVFHRCQTLAGLVVYDV